MLFFSDSQFRRILDRQYASTDGKIRDVYDGRAYKELTKPGGFLDPPGKNFTLSVNTDGVSIYSSSTMGELWPVFLIVNEIPPHLRYTKKYMVLCGFWLGTKPKMTTFLKPLMITLDKIYRQGIEVKVSSHRTEVVRGLLLLACADLPAKAKLVNMKQYNGKFGCNECEDPGKTIGRNHLHRIWPYTESMRLRSHESIKANVVATQYSDGLPVMGIIGASVFLRYPGLDMSKSFPVDYMHAVLSGLEPTLANRWFSSEYSSEPYYIGNFISHLNKQILAVKVPDSVSHRPRRITERHHWKASQWRTWLLQCSLPLVREFLPAVYFGHYCLLVSAIATLVSDEITEDDLTAAEEQLDAFCRSFQTLYGEKPQTMNLHKLRHLAMYVRLYGPLWVFSLFGFESMNGHVKRMVHGTTFIANQITFTKTMSWELWRLALAMPRDPEKPTEVKKLAHTLTSGHGMAKRKKLESGLYSIGTVRERPVQEDHLQALRSAVGHNVNDKCPVFHRAEVHGQTIYSKQYGREKARNSRTVEFTQGGSVHFGEVQMFCCVNEGYFAVVKDLVPVANPLIDLETIHNLIVKEALRSVRRQQVVEITETNTCRAVPISSLRRKCVLMNVESAGNDTSKLYIGRFPNVVEPD
ncbi:uncharacterized protein LOC118419835 [Branchiostoma floridae]|uniref:Uncharacterized protein LOC118419835 n=1 Tax=Branchiostoma floridae TaxID=7739 RepID=A0A9J7LGC5_BRAFL|nr:uncharacterized protein LOC118419835 [Branchiostoma floridae]